MKLTKNLEAEILKLYHRYWDAYLNGKMKTMSSLMDKNCHVIGSGMGEVFKNKKDAVKYYTATTDQIAGVSEMRDRKISLAPAGNNILVTEVSDFFVLMDGSWVFYGQGRFSTLFGKTEKKWLIIQQHGSLPDSRTGGGEQLNTDKIKEENLRLKEAIKKRTVELENKNRELEIEASLERVRAIALSMKEPADMLDVCRTISHQLEALHVKDIRNVQTAIINESKGTYINYEYYSKHDKSLTTEVDFKTHELQELFVNQMLKGAEELFARSLKGKEVKDWYEYQKTTNQFADTYLEKAKSLSYYWYSLGPVALGISTYTPLSEEEINLFKRFRNVFELSYRRFIDIEQAVTQAREAKIEASLEKVRSVAMSMMKSGELLNVCESVFNQLHTLGFNEDELRNSQIVINNDVKGMYYGYQYSDYIGGETAEVPYDMHPIIKMLNDKLRQSSEAFVDIKISGSDLEDWKMFVRSFPQKPDEKLNKTTELHYYFYSVGIGALGISSFQSLSEEKLNILQRLRNVFNLSYQRYLDLAQAEAQAREAQIELALERVRARTMGMQKSVELAETVSILFKQLLNLGVQSSQLRTCGIVTFKENEPQGEIWITDITGEIIADSFIAPYDEAPAYKAIYSKWKNGEKFLEINLKGDELLEHLKFVKNYSAVPNIDIDEIKKSISEIFFHVMFFSQGYLFIISYEPLSEFHEIFNRFGSVFQQAYTRFLDLQKAEAQAREGQIQLALEKVRMVALGLNKSEEMLKVAEALYEQLLELGFSNMRNAIIDIRNGDGDTFTDYDYSHEMSGTITQMSYHDDPTLEGQFKMMATTTNDFFELILEGKELEDLKKMRIKNGEAPDSRLDKIEVLTYNLYSFGNGAIGISNFGVLSEEEKTVLNRFSNVFTFAYKRYNDLASAEAQAREAKIEAALEKVRSKTMAMQKSDELAETAAVVFQQLINLGVEPNRIYIAIIKDEKGSVEFWITDEDGSKVSIGFKANLAENISFNKMFEGWKKQVKSITIDMEGKELEEYFKHLSKINVPFKGGLSQKRRVQNIAYFSQGFIGIASPDLLQNETIDVLKRFAAVFNLTYTRFIDLKEAEARAREAMMQSSLDRLRAEIAGMRSAEDLQHITPLIWHELLTLDVPFIRCGVFIVDEARESVQVYLSTPDGHSLGVLNLSFDANELTSNTVRHWQKKTVYTEHWNKEQFINWMQSMIEIGQVPNNKSYQGADDPPESLNLHFVPFAQGMLYVGNTTPLNNEKIQLVKSLADAFSIAFTRYEDFKNLEEAKTRVEVTLTELKSTQAQLVQAEKLASLGQLTAGIAHEIKNPLNFVNNFSEISCELLDEMKIELQNDNKDEAIAIAEDIKQNLEKINQHGKRADSIVKGMLLHSRGSAGEKSLTNINDLLDQYVNLAYHGLRAQDKEFNITIEKDFDETLEKINVVPQDISRVFLNIVNNGFYAANEKKKNSGTEFAPTLKVSTKNLPEKVEIRIRDNGNGIPQSIKNNIFNPFFTTKPTGEGTGLGLSLSYDIITKVHNGEIIFDTKENEFTEFTITIPKS